MAYWHEIVRMRGGIARYSTNHYTKQVVQRGEQDPEIFEVYFERKEEGKEGPDWFTRGWVQLWPLEPITAPTVEQAKAKALAILEDVARGALDERCEKRPRPVPFHKKRVRECPSPTHQ